MISKNGIKKPNEIQLNYALKCAYEGTVQNQNKLCMKLSYITVLMSELKCLMESTCTGL